MKTYLKQLLVPILSSHLIARFTSRLFDCGVPIFMLHRIAQEGESSIGKTSPTHLRNCLDYLIDNNYRFLSLEELVQSLKKNQEPSPKSIVFTMDDGYVDQAEIACPIFQEYNCPLTFFVITGMLDQAIWPWDAKIAWIIESSNKPSLESCSTVKNLGLKLSSNVSKRTLRRSMQSALQKVDANIIPDILQQLAYDAGITIPDVPPSSYQPMTWEMARNLEDHGICFAPHSVNHNILSRLNQESIEEEIQGAWTTIATELNNPLKIFCYPNGKSIDFGDREIETLKSAGYMAATSTTPGFIGLKNQSGDQIYSLPRLALPNNMTDFIQCCSWIESAKESLFKLK